MCQCGPACARELDFPYAAQRDYEAITKKTALQVRMYHDKQHEKAGKRVFIKRKQADKHGKVLVIHDAWDFSILKQKIGKKFDFIVSDIYLIVKETTEVCDHFALLT